MVSSSYFIIYLSNFQVSKSSGKVIQGKAKLKPSVVKTREVFPEAVMSLQSGIKYFKKKTNDDPRVYGYPSSKNSIMIENADHPELAKAIRARLLACIPDTGAPVPSPQKGLQRYFNALYLGDKLGKAQNDVDLPAKEKKMLEVIKEIMVRKQRDGEVTQVHEEELLSHVTTAFETYQEREVNRALAKNAQDGREEDGENGEADGEGLPRGNAAKRLRTDNE